MMKMNDILRKCLKQILPIFASISDALVEKEELNYELTKNDN